MEVRGFWAQMGWLARWHPTIRWSFEHGWDGLERGGPKLWAELGATPGQLARMPEVWSTQFQAIRAIDDAWPRAWEHVANAPPLIFVEGDVGLLQEPTVAIVGTRRCTSYGIGLARQIARTCTANGHVVASGLAFGIDRHAHEAAMEGGRTIAVVASGLGNTSPRSHGWLRRRIVETGGAIVSTWPDAFEAARWTFPLRNCWIAALAEHTVVVEAPATSGALHTARFAIQLERQVWAVPGRVGDPQLAGGNELLDEGYTRFLGSSRTFAEALGCDRKPDWMDALESGEPWEKVATMAGTSVVEIVQRIHVMEARGELRRLPGNRYERR